MEEMKLYTHEEILDRVIGTKGTPAREKYETDINNFLIGEAIKWAREAKNLTQEQLGELMGVKRFICRCKKEQLFLSYLINNNLCLLML